MTDRTANENCHDEEMRCQYRGGIWRDKEQVKRYPDDHEQYDF